jgi:hypothetical protein
MRLELYYLETVLNKAGIHHPHVMVIDNRSTTSTGPPTPCLLPGAGSRMGYGYGHLCFRGSVQLVLGNKRLGLLRSYGIIRASPGVWYNLVAKLIDLAS